MPPDHDALSLRDGMRAIGDGPGMGQAEDPASLIGRVHLEGLVMLFELVPVATRRIVVHLRQ